MSQLRLFVFLAVLCSCSVLGRADVLPPKTEVIDVSSVEPLVPSQPTSPVTDDAKTKTTTTEASTTTSTTTTEAPTTKSSTTTTTEAPTTTSTTTTTTEAPTTPPAPTPTPKPAPVPSPDQATWAYTDKNNVTCIVVKFSAQLNVSYNQNVDNTTRTASVLVNVPANASLVTVSGNCNGSAQWIALSWPSGAPNSSVLNSLRLNFLKNDTTKVYALRSLNVTVDAKIMVNSSTPGDEVKFAYGEAWQTPEGTSYRCAAPTQLNLTVASEGVQAAALVLTGLQEEAYRTAAGKGFSAARDCGGADLPDAVPIAVGCALGGLVLVVLVAYLVARHRSAARGYLSM